MTAFDIAQRVYETEPCARSFHEDHWHHLQHGFVYSSPTSFAMCREIESSWSADLMLQPWVTSPGGDCWFVWMLAGDASEAIGVLPHRKPFIAFEKRGVVKVRTHDEVMRLATMAKKRLHQATEVNPTLA